MECVSTGLRLGLLACMGTRGMGKEGSFIWLKSWWAARLREDLGNRLAKIAGGNPGRVVRLMGRWLKEDWVVIRGESWVLPSAD